MKLSNRLYPKDGYDEEALTHTSNNVKDIIQSANITTYRDPNDNRLFQWLVTITDSQLGAIQKLDGLKSIEENIILGMVEAAVPLPTSSADMLGSHNVERAIEYMTQTSAGTDLVFASQPT